MIDVVVCCCSSCCSYYIYILCIYKIYFLLCCCCCMLSIIIYYLLYFIINYFIIILFIYIIIIAAAAFAQSTQATLASTLCGQLDSYEQLRFSPVTKNTGYFANKRFCARLPLSPPFAIQSSIRKVHAQRCQLDCPRIRSQRQQRQAGVTLLGRNKTPRHGIATNIGYPCTAMGACDDGKASRSDGR